MRFFTSIIRPAGLMLGLALSQNALAHTSGYQDFYNTKQGRSMSADSGCRLMLCLANPKGPMSEAACVPDVKEMYFEIAMAWKGHGFIPQCIGNMGANIAMAVTIGADGSSKPSGIYFHNDNVTVWRPDFNRERGGDGWYQIYASTRTPVYYPVGGVTDNDNPRAMWNAESGNQGRMNTPYSELGRQYSEGVSEVGAGSFNPQTIGQAGPSTIQPGEDLYSEANSDSPAASAAFKESVKVDPDDLTKLGRNINVFASNDYSDVPAKMFEHAVIASPLIEEGRRFSEIIQATPPVGSYFHKGDRVDVNRFVGKPGDLSKRVPPKNQFVTYSSGTNASTNGLGALTDAAGKTQALPAPAQFDANGNAIYVDNEGKTQVVAPVNTEGYRAEYTVAPTGASANDESARPENVYLGYTGKKLETTQDEKGNTIVQAVDVPMTVNVLDQLMPTAPVVAPVSAMPAE